MPPPVQDGAVKFTVAEAVVVTVALKLVGGDGLVTGTTDAEALEGGRCRPHWSR